MRMIKWMWCLFLQVFFTIRCDVERQEECRSSERGKKRKEKIIIVAQEEEAKNHSHNEFFFYQAISLNDEKVNKWMNKEEDERKGKLGKSSMQILRETNYSVKWFCWLVDSTYVYPFFSSSVLVEQLL